MPLLLLLGIGGLGAFVGAKVNHTFDPPSASSPPEVDPTRVAYYAALAMGLFFLHKKLVK